MEVAALHDPPAAPDVNLEIGVAIECPVRDHGDVELEDGFSGGIQKPAEATLQDFHERPVDRMQNNRDATNVNDDTVVDRHSIGLYVTRLSRATRRGLELLRELNDRLCTVEARHRAVIMLAVASSGIAVVRVSMMSGNEPAGAANQFAMFTEPRRSAKPAPIRFMKQIGPSATSDIQKSLFACELAVRNSVTGLEATTAPPPLRRNGVTRGSATSRYTGTNQISVVAPELAATE